MIKSMQELQQEFLRKARSVELKVDCGPDGTFNSEVAIVACLLYTSDAADD